VPASFCRLFAVLEQVVAYIYFTRIIVFLLAATMPYVEPLLEHRYPLFACLSLTSLRLCRYDWMWTRHLITELATLAFYVVTGFKFKPDDENP